MDEYREYIAHVYKQLFSAETTDLRDDDEQLRYLLEYIPEDKEIIVLDAGCGNGKYAFKLHELGYRNIFAVDLFDGIRTDGKFKYFREGIDSLSFENDKFDFIYLNSVIYYLEDPANAVKEFRRVLKRKGIVLITFHTKYSLYTAWRVIKRAIGLKSAEHLKGVKFRSADYYKRSFEENGFEVIYTGGFGFFDLPRKIYRMICRYFKKGREPVKRGVERNKALAHVKSIMAYHGVIVARKP